jgi:acyl carrier protein
MSLEIENELKLLIIDSLKLEDLDPSEIESEAPLFGDGLGLDSIDALELGIAIQKKYGIVIDSNDDDTKQQFASVKTLTDFILKNRS